MVSWKVVRAPTVCGFETLSKQHDDESPALMSAINPGVSDVTVSEPSELRDALRQHHADALAAYDRLSNDATVVDLRPDADYRNDDSRLRSTRGRTPRTISN